MTFPCTEDHWSSWTQAAALQPLTQRQCIRFQSKSHAAMTGSADRRPSSCFTEALSGREDGWQRGKETGREGRVWDLRREWCQPKKIFKRFFKKKVPAHAFLPHERGWKLLLRRKTAERQKKTRETGKCDIFFLHSEVRSQGRNIKAKWSWAGRCFPPLVVLTHYPPAADFPLIRSEQTAKLNHMSDPH